MKAIIIDLDGTLCNVSHRVHHIQKEPKDWQGFFDACVDDTPNPAIVELYDMASFYGYCIIYVSGRPETHRAQTQAWLKLHCVEFYMLLLMRPAGDYRPDHEVKRELYEQHIAGKYEVLFVVDDRASVVRMWRSLGLTCLQCAEGEF